jgi:hypothetical protein
VERKRMASLSLSSVGNMSPVMTMTSPSWYVLCTIYLIDLTTKNVIEDIRV